MGTEKRMILKLLVDGWEISGDYHEYAIGSKFDKDGNIWVVLCLTDRLEARFLFVAGVCVFLRMERRFQPPMEFVRRAVLDLMQKVTFSIPITRALERNMWIEAFGSREI